MCDDECPHCGARHMSPSRSDDLTGLIEAEGSTFVVLRSPDTSEHDPNYEEIGHFPIRAEAEAFLASYEAP